jgi:hypothetical protein
MEESKKYEGLDVVEVDIKDLEPATYNPRRLTDKAYKDIRASLEKFGPVSPAVINGSDERKNIIIGGHQRIKIWQDMGNSTYPCVYESLSIEEEKELNIRLNKNTAEWDLDALTKEFEVDDLLDFGFDYGQLGIDIGEAEDAIDKLIEEEKPPVYPIVPKFSEKYDYVVIMANNEIDLSYLDSFFELESQKSYKNTRVGVGRVVTFEKFKKLVERREREESK